MIGFTRHVFVCTNARGADNPKGCCASKGSEDVLRRFRSEFTARGLKGAFRANSAGCLDHCAHGVTVVVYPDAVWYAGVRPEDVPELVESHVIGGMPVERLRLATPAPNSDLP